MTDAQRKNLEEMEKGLFFGDAMMAQEKCFCRKCGDVAIILGSAFPKKKGKKPVDIYFCPHCGKKGKRTK